MNQIKNKMYSAFCRDDTTLRLDGFGYGTREAFAFSDSQTNGFDQNTRANMLDGSGCKLVLGLGPTPSVYSNEYAPSRGNQGIGPTPVFSHTPSSQRDSVLELGLSGSADAVSNILDFSASTQSHFDTRPQPDQVDSNTLVVPVVDEGSTSAKKSGGYMRNLIMAPRMENVETLLAKVARGATGMCIGHGGGPRCQKPGCDKGAESRTAYCKAHGGGKRCQRLGCTKSVKGRMNHCIAHGGGKQCGYPGGCTKAARGSSGFCIRHGGGKRCKVEGCARSAEGQIGLCISHGGGRRCQVLGCTKGAQGSTDFCKAHGGGKRCVFTGCTRGAEGITPLCKGHGGGKRCSFDGGGMCPKSVHGGTDFCVAHGGGKRCSVSGCTKSARGRTDCCVKHGGGKRCRFENCGKGAQGCTDLCKAHGGGKRCNWGEGKCGKFARGRSGLCGAHGSMVNGGEAKRVDTIGPGLFRGLVPPTSTSSFEKTCSSSGVSVVSDLVRSSFEKPAKLQQLIPPQVLVPLSMKASTSYLGPLGPEKDQETSTEVDVGGNGAGESFGLVVPEGRVHGGGLLSLLGGSFNNAINGI